MERAGYNGEKWAHLLVRFAGETLVRLERTVEKELARLLREREKVREDRLRTGGDCEVHNVISASHCGED